MAKTVFNRYEKKYLIPEQVYLELRDRLAGYMKEDEYGQYTICNIYYDTADDLLIRRSIEKPKYKEKLRLRSYGVPTLDSKVFLEIKKKYKKIVNKRRIQLPLRDAYAYLEDGIRPDMDSQILREIDFFLDRYSLKPRLYLAYDRIALSGREDAEFRVTFDRRIRSRRVNTGLEQGDAGTLLLPGNWYIMESKIQGAAPLWFSGLLADMKIYTTSFSKYGNIYKKEHGAFDPEIMMKHRIGNWEEAWEKEYHKYETFGRNLVC